MAESGRSYEAYRRFEQAMEIPMLLLSVVFIGLIVVPVFTELSQTITTGVELLEWFIWAIFAFEYLGLLYLAPNRRVMFKTHLLDLLIIVLPFLRPLRFARVLRLSRILALAGRAVEAVKRLNARPGFTGFLAFVIVVVVIGGLSVFSFEHSVAASPIKTVGDGIWWSISTATTVGYGDYYPVTPEGKAIAVVMMLVGIAMLSVTTANIAAYFVHRESGDYLVAVSGRLDVLEGLLVADEIAKLVLLRDAGNLSDHEYVEQKCGSPDDGVGQAAV
jgi:voltage-gated potassium channel